MSTPSSIARSKSAQPVTASVIKFQCLYTHDLRRKSKRWQDGYLKYHTFNKRVMVYDDNGTFVGDHHWRSVDEVQDGDELELDKGVLIEVGERLTTTQTDITNLFDKKKSSQTSPARNHHAPLQSQVPRASTATFPAPSPTSATSNPAPVRSSGSSQSYRSLNDLLGIKKSTPSTYSHEERPRPPSIIQESNEPAQKRQKVAATPSAKDTIAPSKEAPRKITTPPAPIGSIAVKRSQGNATQINPQGHVSSEVVDLTGPEDELVYAKTNHPMDTQPRSNPVAVMPPPKEKPSQRPPKASRPGYPSEDQLPQRNNDIDKEAQESPQVAAPPVSSPKRNLQSVTPARKEKPRNDKARKEESTELASIASDDMFLDAPVGSMPVFMAPPRKKLIHTALLPTKKTEKIERPPLPKKPTEINIPEPKVSMEFAPSDSTQFILEELAEGSSSDVENCPPKQTSYVPRASFTPKNQPRKHDAPFRKSLSDPSLLTRPALEPRPTLMRNALNAVPEEAEVREEGPWTSDALDLFDFWPPGRPKPPGLGNSR